MMATDLFYELVSKFEFRWNSVPYILLVTLFLLLFRRIISLSINAILLIIQIGFGSYQIFRIILDLITFSVIKAIIFLTKMLHKLLPISEIEMLRRRLWQAQTYREWSALASDINRLDGSLQLNDESEGFCSISKLVDTIALLKRLRKNRDFKELMFQLPAYVKRDHLGMVESSLFTPCYIGTNNVVDQFIEEIKACCLYLCEEVNVLLPPHEKLNFIGKLYKSLGQTALCLSGGGSLSMYHMGVLRALIESGNYQNVQNKIYYIELCRYYLFIFIFLLFFIFVRFMLFLEHLVDQSVLHSALAIRRNN